MKTYLDCVPCFMRQALDAARMTTDDESVHEEVLRRVAHEVSKMDMGLSPPAMGQKIHRLIRELTGDPDPYRVAKEYTNRLAMALYPEIRNRVREASDPLEMAVRTAIAGNIIDLGVNRGEIVFDRVLIELLAPRRVTVVVRGRPVLNDALRADAEAAGLTGLVEILDNGSDAPGTMLDDCTETFHSRFMDAGMVIAKGQGNYETLSNAPRPVWFILMAKCEVIARHIGCEPGSFVLQRGP